MVVKIKMTKRKTEEILSKIKATDKPEFEGCDLIIEAVLKTEHYKHK